MSDITISYNGNDYTYSNPNQVQFVQDMQVAGLSIRHYEGRNSYRGPAVVCKDVNEVRDNTQVKLHWDNLGMQKIVYPAK